MTFDDEEPEATTGPCTHATNVFVVVGFGVAGIAAFHRRHISGFVG